MRSDELIILTVLHLSRVTDTETNQCVSFCNEKTGVTLKIPGPYGQLKAGHGRTVTPNADAAIAGTDVATPAANDVTPATTNVTPTANYVMSAVTEVIPAVTDASSADTDVTQTATDAPPANTDAAPAATDVVPAVNEVTPTVTYVARAATYVTPAATDVVLVATDAAPTATDVEPSTTDVTPTATDVVSAATDVAPTPTDVVSAATDVAPADTDFTIAATDGISVTTDVAPATTDVTPAATDVTPAATDVTPVTDSAPSGTDATSAATDATAECASKLSQVKGLKRQADDEVSIVAEHGAKARKIAVPITATKLKKLIKSLKERTTWLSDDHMDHAQGLLKKQYPQFSSLQPVCIFETDGCQQVGKPVGVFVQILNMCGNHWIVVSNSQCSSNTVRVYDSFYRPYKDMERNRLLKQLACLVGSENSLTAEWVDMQQQEGDTDCGLFAIAAAVSLCQGNSPELIKWDQDAMRNHLVSCFSGGKLTEFPVGGPRNSNRVQSPKTVPLYCHCNMPDDGKFMIECNNCYGWYHRGCDTVPKRVTKKTVFLCKKCK